MKYKPNTDTEFDERSAAYHDEAARIAAWHATFNAAITGMISNSLFTETVRYAAQIADTAHGPIE